MRVLTLGCVMIAALPALVRLGTAEEAHDTRPNLTVLLRYEHPYSAPSFSALERQLRSLLAEAGLQVEVRERKDANAREEYTDVVVFNMKGHCTMAARPAPNPLPVGALSDERGPLAMAYSADGNILPFGEVECDQVRESLERVLGKGAPDRYQATYGAALGTVMAHEVYHMLSHRAKHTKTGITKESLSAREMLEGKLTLSDKAREAIARAVLPVER
ncbi:MAG TPA: hypothetical protein VKX25_07490 [Bryobacteraceae bacterium]|nr:hypothetical protein [Bryobacteraceae bacterium]